MAPSDTELMTEVRDGRIESLAEQEALAKVIIKEKEIKEVQVKFDEESRKTAEARRAAREKKAEGMKTEQGEI